MRKHLIFLLVGLMPAFAQAPQQPGTGGVIRITVDLVQVDAVVTDSKGRQVTNLKPEDFEILEDRRPQKITNFSYVSVTGPAGSVAPPIERPPLKTGAPTAPARPVPLRPEQVRRTIALVVDDLSLSFEDTYYVRQTLKKFVDVQMQPGDLVAILRTASGLGAMQQFTNDKRMLYAAIDRIRWYPMWGGQIFAITPLAPAEGNSRRGAGGLSQGGSQPTPASALVGHETASQEQAAFFADQFTNGSLGAVNYVVKGLRELPGRKSVILFSDGIPLSLESVGDSRVLEALRALVDLANRSAVVVYVIDARGLQTLGLTAADSTGGRSPAEVEQALEQALGERRLQYFNSQQGMEYLAQQSGGFLVHDTNDLNLGIREILDDQSGYYLIGYKPSETTFEAQNGRRAYHKIQVKVKIPGLRVRSRTGFYGIPDDEARPVYRTRNEQLAAALASPFSSGGVHLYLVSQVLYDEHGAATLRSLLHIDARDLQVENQPDGRKKVAFDAAALTFGDNGRVVGGKDATFTGSLNDQQLGRALKNGLDHVLDFPVKPGRYQLRAGVRDSVSQRVGSASLFIDVPDTRKGRLALSGIILNARGEGEKSPAVRRFQLGDEVTYGVQVYNARLDRVTRLPDLEESIQIFRDERQVSAFNKAFDGNNQTDLRRLSLSGHLKLGPGLEPGDYVFQVIVTDKLAKPKYATASQWIDFEIAGQSERSALPAN
ncbi:MAG: VWA domain-containing protein [Terriglobia bacterium]|jgi:VWFA-related protein